MDDLRDDQDSEGARGPAQVLEEAKRGGLALLPEPAGGPPGRKQPASHAIAECRSRNARNKSFANLFETDGQQPQRIKSEQSRGGRQRRARRKPHEYPQRRPSLGRWRVRRVSDQSGKPPSGQSDRKCNESNYDQDA